ncbi:MAG: hypothetical protein F6K58_19970 [Symploca sp. SIO2E9]|nr:hypothetical protein [Symploca sp. SIO2E9]
MKNSITQTEIRRRILELERILAAIESYEKFVKAKTSLPSNLEQKRSPQNSSKK